MYDVSMVVQLKGVAVEVIVHLQKELNNYVVEKVAVKWKDLGLELLKSESAQYILDNIEADYKGDVCNSSHIL